MNDIVKNYLSRIGKIPVMDHETLVDCFKILKDPDTKPERKKQIRDHIIISNLKLVVSIAKQYKATDKLHFEDIIQEGNTGLMKAIKMYNHKLGFKFSTYATWWIRQAISIYVAKNRQTVRIPSHALGVQRRIMTAIEEYNEKTGQTPTINELKELLSDVSDTIIEAVLHAGSGTVSIHSASPWHNDGNSNISNADTQIASRCLENRLYNKEDDPFVLFSRAEMFDVISSVMSELTVREAAVIRMRFGLYDMGITREDYIEECDE